MQNQMQSEIDPCSQDAINPPILQVIESSPTFRAGINYGNLTPIVKKESLTIKMNLNENMPNPNQ